MDAETTHQEPEKSSALWLNELSNPEIQEALATLIRKLPQITDAMEKAEQGIEMVSAFASDAESINYLAGRVSPLSKMALSQENLEALTVIIEKLPSIAKSVALLERVSSLVEPLANRDMLIAVTETVELVTSPVKERVQDGASIVKEAKERAERNQSTVSIFGLMKMLKDPAVQKGIKFVQALLDVLSEKKVIK
ncbi:DUF1641 domain-containing protein [Aneurinibacillus tyrosinisolvens]|uniref:DUF1641 domain-containing protein n=1 Tax=Aneurinibacillus tyrosinisolvens TaxID=1443435 RepID=UPI00069AD430|nr:DUF1641 domain-containing protein [Aneurinibacillus tyrosinisolvens]